MPLMHLKAAHLKARRRTPRRATPPHSLSHQVRRKLVTAVFNLLDEAGDGNGALSVGDIEAAYRFSGMGWVGCGWARVWWRRQRRALGQRH